MELPWAPPPAPFPKRVDIFLHTTPVIVSTNFNVMKLSDYNFNFVYN